MFQGKGAMFLTELLLLDVIVQCANLWLQYNFSCQLITEPRPTINSKINSNTLEETKHSMTNSTT